MPDIIAVLSVEDTELREVLNEYKNIIRKDFACMFEYATEDVCWDPRLRSVEELADSENTPRFQLYIEVGQKDFKKGDAAHFKLLLMQGCPELEKFDFPVWLKSSGSSDFCA